MSNEKNWIITTTNDRQFGEIVDEIAKTGFRTDSVLREIGAITGRATDDVASRLRNIPGITDVSQDQQVDIGPPDAPVTW